MDRRNFPRFPQKELKMEDLADLTPPLTGSNLGNVTGRPEPWKWVKIFGDLREYVKRLRTDVDKAQRGGATGWFDDGANFRITVSNGHITAIENTVVGGHS